jgi:hypothetical protein
VVWVKLRRKQLTETPTRICGTLNTLAMAHAPPRIVCIALHFRDEPNSLMAPTKKHRGPQQEGFDMRLTALFGLAAVLLAVIVTVAPKATVIGNDMSSEIYGISFMPASQPTQTLAAR